MKLALCLPNFRDHVTVKELEDLTSLAEEFADFDKCGFGWKPVLTTPVLWPPFQDVPVSKTLDDLKRLKEEIMPKVESA